MDPDIYYNLSNPSLVDPVSRLYIVLIYVCLSCSASAYRNYMIIMVLATLFRNIHNS